MPSTDACITRAEAVGVLKEVREGGSASSHAAGASRSALELLMTKKDMTPIITFCGEIDRMLGGGIPMGEVTEFVGTPGIGKTQLGIQLSVDAHLPRTYGGAEGEAVYIDTEGSFMAERAYEIAEAFSNHVHKMARLKCQAPPIRKCCFAFCYHNLVVGKDRSLKPDSCYLLAMGRLSAHDPSAAAAAEGLSAEEIMGKTCIAPPGMSRKSSFNVKRDLGASPCMPAEIDSAQLPQPPSPFHTHTKTLSRYIYRVHDFCEQIACIRQLPDFLDTHPNVKLIVVDRFRALPCDLRYQDVRMTLSTTAQIATLSRECTTKITRWPMPCAVSHFISGTTSTTSRRDRVC